MYFRISNKWFHNYEYIGVSIIYIIQTNYLFNLRLYAIFSPQINANRGVHLVLLLWNVYYLFSYSNITTARIVQPFLIRRSSVWSLFRLKWMTERFIKAGHFVNPVFFISLFSFLIIDIRLSNNWNYCKLN